MAERPTAIEERARTSRFRPKRLDHVALWVADRDGIADFASAHLGMHVIQRTEAFTLIGADARRGKLTLFEAEPPREHGLLEQIGLRVNDLEAAAAALPAGQPVERHERGLRLEVSDGLWLALVQAGTEVDYDLDHVALRSGSPISAAAAYASFGFVPSGSGMPSLLCGDVAVELVEGDPGLTERPLLNHLGLLVDSAQEHLEVAEGEGVEVLDVVDAPNTLAVYVAGPDGVKLEYVEHKPGFSLE
jgi:catechol 2,3-dioxygenase-like lactoylglutathione lyase family enzyme